MLALLLSQSISLNAQNLLKNGSFELHDSCPNTFDQIRFARYWDAIDTNYVFADSAFFSFSDQYPEYVNVCGAGAASVPINPNFHHYPRTGNGMVQSAIFNDYSLTITSGIYWFNYFQGRLINRLTAGQSYCVTFYTLQEPGSQYAINKIGAYLDDGSIDTTRTPAKVQSQYTPQVFDTSVISDTVNWTRIQGSFVANGAEKFITIGMFFDTGNVRHVNVLYSISGYGLYLFDDISVIPSNAHAYAGPDTTIRHAGDTATLGPTVNGDGMPCSWYKMGSTTPIDSGGNIKVHPMATTSYIVKMDLCGTVTYDTVKVRVWPDTVSHVGVSQLGLTAIQIYPNPASDEVIVEGAEGYSVGIFDLLGRCMVPPVIAAEKQVLQISRLASGLYCIRMTNEVTKEVFTSRLVKE